MRWLLALFCLSFVTVSQASFVTTVTPSNAPMIEKVLVLKSAHRLQLIADGKGILLFFRDDKRNDAPVDQVAAITLRRIFNCNVCIPAQHSLT